MYTLIGHLGALIGEDTERDNVQGIKRRKREKRGEVRKTIVWSGAPQYQYQGSEHKLT